MSAPFAPIRRPSEWQLIAGGMWALVEVGADRGYDNHVCCVELDRGKYVTVLGFERPLSERELREILEILREASADLAPWWENVQAAVAAGFRSARSFTA